MLFGWQSTEAVSKTRFTVDAGNDPEYTASHNDSTASKGACKLLCAWAHPVHYHANKSRQAGCWLTAGVHTLSQSGRCRQVKACSQPLPRLLLWGGVNVAARDDSRLLLSGLSLARFYMWKESYEERSWCYQNDEEKWIDEGLRTEHLCFAVMKRGNHALWGQLGS